jgi:DNA repair exonuclease SbcCD ATPase subunit
MLNFSGTNFQAWESFELEIKGLTVVIGPSNHGKSSIDRAIRALFRNELAQGQVRLGQKEATLTAKIAGKTITASRTAKGSTKYVIDGGKPLTSLGGAVPEDVSKLGLNRVKIEDITLDPVFSPQGEPQFMLSSLPTPLNHILGAFSSTDKLEAGKREANAAIQEKNAQAKALSIQIQSAETKKAELEALSQKAEVIFAAIGELEPMVKRLEDVILWLGHLAERKKRHTAITSLLDKLAIPDPAPVQRATVIVSTLATAVEAKSTSLALKHLIEKTEVPDLQPAFRGHTIVGRIGQYQQATVRLTMIHEVNALVDETAKLDKASTHLSRSVEWLGAYVENKRKHDVLKKSLVAIKIVEADWTVIRECWKRARAISDYLDAKSVMEQSPAKEQAKQLNAIGNAIEDGNIAALKLLQRITWIGNLARHQPAYMATAAQVQQLANEIDLEQVQINRLQAELQAEQAQKELITCPKCGEKFSQEHTHATQGGKHGSNGNA